MSTFIIKSRDDIDNYLRTDEQCEQFLINSLWQGKPRCPNCISKDRVYYIKSRKAFKCSTCNSHISIKKGTIFENSNVPLRLWYKAIFNMSTKNTSNSYKATQAVIDLGVSYKTALYMTHKIREVMRVDNEKIILQGIIEADEVYSGPQLSKDNSLRYKVYTAENERVIWGLETEEELKSRLKREAKWETKTGKTFPSLKSRLDEFKKTPGIIQNSLFFDLDNLEAQFPKHHYKKNLVNFLQRDVAEYFIKNGKKHKKIIEYGKLVVNVVGREKGDVDMNNITPLIEKKIKKGSILITDETNIYNGAKTIVKKHFKIQHSKKKNETHKPIKYSIELSPEEDEYGIKHLSTNGVENVNKQIRTFDREYVHISYEHSERYYFELAFNYNCRGLNVHERFNSFLKVALATTVSIKDIFDSRRYYSFRPNRLVRELKKFS
ncbi:MAG: transposase [Crocinitomicaceae bacterium]|nr:transposase [Crocinitomicaceae bacterium]MCF8432928.1 transposase [Crocinitomicaceae bacterium]